MDGFVLPVRERLENSDGVVRKAARRPGLEILSILHCRFGGSFPASPIQGDRRNFRRRSGLESPGPAPVDPNPILRDCDLDFDCDRFASGIAIRFPAPGIGCLGTHDRRLWNSLVAAVGDRTLLEILLVVAAPGNRRCGRGGIADPGMEAPARSVRRTDNPVDGVVFSIPYGCFETGVHPSERVWREGEGADSSAEMGVE